ALTVTNTLMHPKGKNVIAINPSLLQETEDRNETSSQETFAEKMENARPISMIASILGLSFLFVNLFIRKKNLDLNSVIMLFLFLGLILHKSPKEYVKHFSKATSGAAGILLQFPFYAGIMGIITGTASSGVSLGEIISNAFVSISNGVTFPLFTFLSAGIINVFVPSGGGQWAVQAPIMFEAGRSLNVAPELTGMAIAWGDAWTNLIQPFWALPALAIAKLSAKDIMGFCLIDLLITGIIISLGLILWAV
ncbi:MAG: TIGR00366 family protein, partial [Bacteroidales bacterium]|nr:TIGR00366 family protein [Bacteroidales bacterium]